MLHKQLDSCFIYLSKASDAAQKTGYKKGEAQSYRTLGSYYAFRSNSYLSFRFYLDALKIYETLGDSTGVCLLNMDIGTYYQYEGKHRVAARYMQEAVGMAQRLNNDSLNITVSARYYFIYRYTYADAAKALGHAHDLALQYKDERMALYTGMLQADELLDKGDTLRAERKLDTLINEALNKGFIYHALYGYSQMAEYKGFQHSADSLYYQQQLLHTALKAGYRELVLPTAIALYTHFKTEEYNNAILDIIEKKEQTNTQGELEYKDDYMQKKQLRELRLEHDYQQQLLDKRAIGSRDRYIIIIALIILLLLTILFLADINRSYRRSGRNARRLGEKNREISEQNVLLSAQDDFKNKLISLIAHDFRAPLIHITDITTLLRSKMLMLEDAAKLFRRLETNAQDTLHVFDNILRWIRSQLTGFVYIPVVCYPAAMIREALTSLKETCEEKSLNIKMYVPEDMQVLADREMLQFVHRNLLHNAVKFSRTSCTITIYASNNTVYFKDEGRGIKAEALDHMFEYHNSGKGNSGAGLALIICKDFIDKMNGSITAVNNTDKGSTFSYTLPAAK